MGIGLLGLGVVGGGVFKALTQNAERLSQKAHRTIYVKSVLVRDPKKQRAIKLPARILTTEPEPVLSDPEIGIIVELLGGEEPAVDYIRRALRNGKHVVTANKEVIAKHGLELLKLAERNGVSLLFEASVGGGIPVIGPIMDDLSANRVRSIQAIINGTTNYILTRMAQAGLDFQDALKEAQQLGYAEPDPTNDVEGIDAAYKLTVLATLAFHVPLRVEDVYREGITRLQAKDFRYAQELGYAIKLLAIARRSGNAVQLRVHPAWVPQERLLARVDGAFNAVEVEGDLVGRVVFHGRGAGPDPTASAVIGDILEVCRRISAGHVGSTSIHLEKGLHLLPMADVETRYYIRLTAADRPGVLAQVAAIMGRQNISIDSVIQKDADRSAQTAEIVITTHLSKEASVRQALSEISALSVIPKVSNFVRIEDRPDEGVVE
jgi:homoserine dehydrogenase